MLIKNVNDKLKTERITRNDAIILTLNEINMCHIFMILYFLHS